MTGRGCEQVRRQLEWFVGDDLDTASADAVRSHLRDCVQCRNAAGSLQQAIKGLRAVAGSGHPAVDDAMFAAMHATIVARVRTEPRPVAERPGRARRWLPIAAALAVFAIGWWSVREPVGRSVFERPPLGPLENVGGPVEVVPWSGPRVPLRRLGDERFGDDSGAAGVGPGMMGRWRLRTLDGVDAPPRSAIPVRVGDPDPGDRIGRDR